VRERYGASSVREARHRDALVADGDRLAAVPASEEQSVELETAAQNCTSMPPSPRP
jgi:hypothetical protein